MTQRDFIFLAFAIIPWIFSSGVLWAKMHNLEKAVLNGLTEAVSKHSERLARIEAGCEARHGNDL